MQKRRDAKLSGPLRLGEILKRLQKEEMRSWLEPKSGDLLRDVGYLQGQIAAEKSAIVRGIYARSTIVMSVATIEAITNDALAVIYELLADSIPSEMVHEPPWCHFLGRSTRRIAGLLERSGFSKKRTYVLGQIERLTGRTPGEALLADMDRLVLFRNRIVHMSYHAKPDRYRSLLNTGQLAPIAARAKTVAYEYVEFLSQQFADLKLPISTIRPAWCLESDRER